MSGVRITSSAPFFDKNQYVDLGDIKSGTNLSWDSRDLKAPYSGAEITSNEFNVGLQIIF